ncbi:DUF2834 domain-containing protein [Bacillus megaterium]|nr:DUF2834 domain-containing protein [Priestia megaterium]
MTYFSISIFFCFNRSGRISLWLPWYFSQAFNNYASMQIFFDLLIALILVLVWMWHDTKKTNRSFGHGH